MKNRKIRYAVVGQGHISQVAVLPAFKHAKNSELVALVSGDNKKLQKLGRKYRVDHLFSYDDFDECLKSGEIDAVYIATPNHLHRKLAEKAAQAGVHILCEKPMAVSPEDCEAMTSAARVAQVKLMIAYRLHFDRANLETVELIRKGKIGEPRVFNSVFSYPVKERNIRANPEDMGGGAIFDIGIYCINAARYLFRAEPLEVFAMTGDRGQDQLANKKLPNIHETYSVTMRFPEDRLATFTCSFGMATKTYFEVIGTKGDVRLENAYEYAGKVTQLLTVNKKTRTKVFPQHDQFAAELLYFSDCILRNKEPEPGGEEGLADVLIIEAIRRSAERRVPIPLNLAEKLTDKKERPTLRQEIYQPAVREPRLVKVHAPAKEVA